MKIYIASHDQVKARALKAELLRHGHSVTSRWIDEEHLFPLGLGLNDPEYLSAIAEMDLFDIRAADTLILISPSGEMAATGGRFVEMGYALGQGKQVILLGEMSSVFGYLPQVMWVSDVQTLVRVLGKDGERCLPSLH